MQVVAKPMIHARIKAKTKDFPLFNLTEIK